jgi:hypothetical protein
MLQKYPHMNTYWEGKRAKAEDNVVPVYAVANSSSVDHTVGFLHGHEDIEHDQKETRDGFQVIFNNYLKRVQKRLGGHAEENTELSEMLRTGNRVNVERHEV